MHSIINRLTNELVRRGKLVDVLFVKDVLCGTRTRPCPKYVGNEETVGLQAAPDVFLFPQRVPSRDDPAPPVHAVDELELPRLVLDLFGVDPPARVSHVWEVHVKNAERADGMLSRAVQVWHKGELVDESRSRPWRPGGRRS